MSRLDASFPIVIEKPDGLTRASEVAGWIRSERDRLHGSVESIGALLLRGFPIASPEDFDGCVDAFDLGRFSYRESLSNAVRIDLTDRVFTANEAPPEATIKLHHELAQTPAHPRHLFFFCERAADRGGATALCRSDALHDRLERSMPDFIHDLERYGVVYRHVMPATDDPDSSMGRSWRSTLSVETKEEAEGRLVSLGYRSQWLEDDALEVVTPPLPGIRVLPDGRSTFFNQIVATRAWRDVRNDPERAVRLGDGRSISLERRDEIAEQTESLALDHLWQAGDLVVLDNHRLQHGRRPFEGCRRVLVAFGARA